MQQASLYADVPQTDDDAYRALAAEWERRMRFQLGCRTMPEPRDEAPDAAPDEVTP